MKLNFLLSIILFCSGCVLFKTNILNQGHFEPIEGFHTTISFDDPLNLVVIPVEIGGITYRFLLDTGAPNVISPEIQRKYQFKKIKKGNIRDSQGNIKKSEYVRLDRIRIGETIFFNTAAIVIDLKSNPVLRCLELDGIIGSNLMRFCSWRMDYSSKSVTLTTFPEQLPYSSEFVESGFKTNRQFDVMIELKSSDMVVDNLKIDYGSTGAINLNEDNYNILLKSNGLINLAIEIGYIQSGIFGELHRDTTNSAMLQNGFIGTLPIENVEIVSRSKNLLGTKILRNFVVTINWPKQTIGFEWIKPGLKTIRNKFGFNIGYHNGNTIVKSVVVGSAAFQTGLEPGMQIKLIGNHYFDDLDDFCSYILRDAENENHIIVQAGTENNLKTYEIQASENNN